AAADRRAAHANIAAATVLHAAHQAIAASANHFAALLVAADAGEAHAVFGRFAGASTAAQIALAHHHAVPHAAAATDAAGHRFAQALQGAAGLFVVAAAVDLHTAGALLHLDRAARDHHRVAGHRHAAHHL